MLKFIIVIFPLIIITAACGQEAGKSRSFRPFSPKITTISHKLGDRTILLKTYQYSDIRDIVYINVHDDEITAVNGAKKILERTGGYLIRIENYKTRNIRFRLDGKEYSFDPNRIFSRSGVMQTLTLHGRVSNKAIEEVERFGKRILALLPEKPTCILALHNNSNGKFSINSYLPGNVRERDARKLNVNPEEDPDDIYLTTDSSLYHALAKGNYNTVLQDNARAKKDGSLSIYCGERGIRYINCETEHGRDEQYEEMILKATASVNEKINAGNSYSFMLSEPAAQASARSFPDIMFGDKKVGLIRTVSIDSSWATVGKLEMQEDFPLYSNMDFYLFLSSLKSPRFEVRIDPTRQKELLDPAKAVVSIKAVKN